MLMGMENLTVYTDQAQDPYITAGDNEEDSEEEDDFNLLPTDNLIAVGHIEGDAAILEIHGNNIINKTLFDSLLENKKYFVFIVYNAEEAHLYVHHETLLPALPLCMEWMDYNPNEDTPGIEYLS